MTVKEAIKLIRELPTVCYYTDAYGGPIDNEPELYIKALDMAIAAVKKQEGKKPFPDSDKSILACPHCGSGEYLHNADENINQYCGQCGQKIDWTEGE